MRFLLQSYSINKIRPSGYVFNRPSPLYNYVGWDNSTGISSIQPSNIIDVTSDKIYTQHWQAVEDGIVVGASIYLGSTYGAEYLYLVVYKEGVLIGYKEVTSVSKDGWLNYNKFTETFPGSLEFVSGDNLYFGLAISSSGDSTFIGTQIAASEIESNFYEVSNPIVSYMNIPENVTWVKNSNLELSAILQYKIKLDLNAPLTEEVYNAILTKAFYDANLTE